MPTALDFAFFTSLASSIYFILFYFILVLTNTEGNKI
jgi:hypothetical protein